MKKQHLKKWIAIAVCAAAVVLCLALAAGDPRLFPELHTQAAMEENSGETIPDRAEGPDQAASAAPEVPDSGETADGEALSGTGEEEAADGEKTGGVFYSVSSSETPESSGKNEERDEPAEDEDARWAEKVLTDLPFSWDASRIITYFTAPFPSNQSSERNAKLAAAYLNGTVVAAGETFSYNDTVGERTKGRGFRTAPVIYGDQIGDGLGGGVCEISTMLYNVCLQSGLEVTERSPHTLQVPYVPGGLDAAVSWGSRDFQFRNIYREPVTILTDYDNDREKFIMVLASKSGKSLLGGLRYVPVSVKKSADPDDLTYESYLQVWHGAVMTSQTDLGETAYYGVDDAE